MSKLCFPEPGQLWNNLDRIRHIPCVIVAGRWDMPCPMSTSYRFHKEMENSELIIVEDAGHGGPEMMDATAEAVRMLE